MAKRLIGPVEDGVNGKTIFLDFKMTAVPNATPAQVYIDFSWLISQNDGDKHNSNTIKKISDDLVQ